MTTALLILALFGGTIAFWLFSPTRHKLNNDIREQVICYIVTNPYSISWEERNYYIKTYKLKPEEIEINLVDYINSVISK